MRSSTPPCSTGLQTAYLPLLRTFTKTAGNPQGKREATIRPRRWGIEHIPAFLQEDWHQHHLAPLNCGRQTNNARRTAAITLVQWAGGGAVGESAAFLGLNVRPHSGQYSSPVEFTRWLHDLGRARFTAALHQLAQDLDDEHHLVNYRHRRDALRDWSLDPATWQNILDQLPPVPGPVQPVLDDRMRQEASSFIWAINVTQGEPRFAPRPIEAAQPEHIRNTWAQRRANTWSKLRRPTMNHYRALPTALLHHAQQLANDLDG